VDLFIGYGFATKTKEKLEGKMKDRKASHLSLRGFTSEIRLHTKDGFHIQ